MSEQTDNRNAPAAKKKPSTTLSMVSGFGFLVLGLVLAFVYPIGVASPFMVAGWTCILAQAAMVLLSIPLRNRAIRVASVFEFSSFCLIFVVFILTVIFP